MKAKKVKAQRHRVGPLKHPVAIVSYCAEAFPILGSKTAVKKAIAKGRLFYNGQLADFGQKLKQGDQLELRGAQLSQARKFDLEIPIVFEDDHLMVANKPAGIAVNGNRIKTLENALAGKPPLSPASDALPRPVAVHRIDVPTNGLVVLAKTKSA
ncbi:MAG: pseudouridine synthase, partial [Bacteroidota bacterium]